MFKKFRISLIKWLIDINEKFFFERRLKKVYREIFKNQLCLAFDVGANKGQTISFFRQIDASCMIYAFEPNTSLYKKLEKKYGKERDIRLCNVGVSDQTGEKLFMENVLDYTSTFEEIDLTSKYLQNKSAILGVKPESVIKDKYMVKTIELSDFINREVNETIDMIKIDIEGHEYAALQGLFKRRTNHPVRYIQIENHSDDMYLNKISFEKIEKLLADNGFLQFASVPHGFGKISDIIFRNKNL